MSTFTHTPRDRSPAAVSTDISEIKTDRASEEDYLFSVCSTTEAILILLCYRRLGTLNKVNRTEKVSAVFFNIDGVTKKDAPDPFLSSISPFDILSTEKKGETRSLVTKREEMKVNEAKKRESMSGGTAPGV